jgi:hypothetical protein
VGISLVARRTDFIVAPSTSESAVIGFVVVLIFEQFKEVPNVRLPL